MVDGLEKVVQLATWKKYVKALVFRHYRLIAANKGYKIDRLERKQKIGTKEKFLKCILSMREDFSRICYSNAQIHTVTWKGVV